MSTWMLLREHQWTRWNRRVRPRALARPPRHPPCGGPTLRPGSGSRRTCSGPSPMPPPQAVPPQCRSGVGRCPVPPWTSEPGGLRWRNAPLGATRPVCSEAFVTPNRGAGGMGAGGDAGAVPTTSALPSPQFMPRGRVLTIEAPPFLTRGPVATGSRNFVSSRQPCILYSLSCTLVVYWCTLRDPTILIVHVIYISCKCPRSMCTVKLWWDSQHHKGTPLNKYQQKIPTRRHAQHITPESVACMGQ